MVHMHLLDRLQKCCHPFSPPIYAHPTSPLHSRVMGRPHPKPKQQFRYGQVRTGSMNTYPFVIPAVPPPNPYKFASHIYACVNPVTSWSICAQAAAEAATPAAAEAAAQAAAEPAAEVSRLCAPGPCSTVAPWHAHKTPLRAVPKQRRPLAHRPAGVPCVRT